ncbi:allantoinase AllB [Lacrimispora sp. JR3]|uniref:allantoinase AllB n=1 Tax=Lacrimispora sinapis TaxID=3111456 RepID=UPI00374997CB
MLDLVLKNGNVYVEGSFKETAVGVKDGKIVIISDEAWMPEAEKVIDIKGQYVIPGTIDTHVHFRDPGRSERETFYTGSLAAAAGGVTTVMEHPISMPPQYNKEILDNRIKVADCQSIVDYCFYGAAGAQFPEEITKLAKEGIVAYKTFLHAAPEGRDKEFIGLTMANDAELLIGLTEVAKTGLICATHAENNDMISANIKRLRKEGKVSGRDHALSRPPISEIESVEKMLRLARETGAIIEFAHISTPEAMELIRKAKYDGQEVYLETCPHYLFLDEDDLERFGTFAKCNPPLRKKELVEGLWKYIQDGSVDFIGSDHSPFLLSEKETGYEDIFKAPAGFPGIDLRLPLMLDAAAEGKVTIERVVELLVTNPAKIFKLFPQKGAIRVGSDADFVVFTMDETTVVDKNKCYSKAKDIAIPYDGRTLKCSLSYTIVRGRVLMEHGIVDESAKAYGQLVKPAGA